MNNLFHDAGMFDVARRAKHFGGELRRVEALPGAVLRRNSSGNRALGLDVKNRMYGAKSVS